MSSNIPAARALLQQALLPEKTGPEMRALIVDALKQMKRHRYKPVTARARHARLTPEMARDIRAFVRKYPHLSTLQVAERFNTNPGRVSEALAGDYE